MPRQSLTIISGIAILVAHWHCALGHGDAWHSAPENQTGTGCVLSIAENTPSPVKHDSHGCENHFGCICKGATLGILFSWTDSADFQFLSRMPALFEAKTPVTCAVRFEYPFWHSPRSSTALQICAQHQSYQL